jgi:hypothetical protein
MIPFEHPTAQSFCIGSNATFAALDGDPKHSES